MWAKDLEYLIALAEEEGEEPAALQEIPRLPEPYASYLEAFFILHRSRHYGFAAPSGIALSEMRAFCAVYKVADPQRFVAVMQELDKVFLEHYERKNKAAEPS